MSGIYIHGMEMPKSCQSCFANEYQVCGFKDENAAINGRLGGCPLIPVPEHGRLIDADVLCEGRVSNDNVVICAKVAPTIIPADKEGE